MSGRLGRWIYECLALSALRVSQVFTESLWPGTPLILRVSDAHTNGRPSKRSSSHETEACQIPSSLVWAYLVKCVALLQSHAPQFKVMQILDRRQQREREATEERSMWSLLVAFNRVNLHWRSVVPAHSRPPLAGRNSLHHWCRQQVAFDKASTLLMQRTVLLGFTRSSTVEP